LLIKVAAPATGAEESSDPWKDPQSERSGALWMLIAHKENPDSVENRVNELQ